MKPIELAQGLLTGLEMDGYTVYKNIPFAKPPVGKLRFMPPQKPEPWEGIYKAENFGNRAWQANHPKDSFWAKEFYPDEDALPKRDEDCLNVNVWVPAGAKSGDQLPVALWIHGGAFMHGFNCEMEFDGAGFTRRGVILVQTNYRTGIFGFLTHPWLGENSGNMGIKDQIAAIDWVRENIGAFGGDPEHITIFGQSAGAMSVQTLLSSPMTTGKIQGAIMQSGGGYKYGYSRDVQRQELEQMHMAMVEAWGIKSLEELKAVPAERLMEMSYEMMNAGKARFAPVIDGKVLVKGYNQTIEDGDIPDIPIMLGSNSEDLGMNDLPKGCEAWSTKLQEKGHQPSYVYYFAQQPLGDDAGAFHSCELWYVFETLERSWRPKTSGDYALAKAMADAWVQFVKTGDPGWKPCTTEEPYSQILKNEEE